MVGYIEVDALEDVLVSKPLVKADDTQDFGGTCVRTRVLSATENLTYTVPPTCSRDCVRAVYQSVKRMSGQEMAINSRLATT